MKRTGAEIIWETLVQEGVDVVFGYPGGAILPAYDALEGSGIKHVLVRHEQGASHMADGYARASGKLGACVATSGPGATNLVTGIATAMMDSSPIICITGQVPGPMIGKDAFQEADITGISQPITKHNYLVTQTQDIHRVIREACYVAQSGRPGPVLVDITKDAQTTTIDFEPETEPIRLPGYRPKHTPLPELFDEARKLIEQSKRPLILAGQGIVTSDSGAALAAFIDKTGIPVATTLLGLGGLPSKHPLNLGMMGMHGEAWVNVAIQEADLLIALGMRFDDRVTGKIENYASNSRKIHVDIDPAEINKNVPVDVGIVSDAGDVLRILTPKVKAKNIAPWVDHIMQMQESDTDRNIENIPDTGHMQAAQVIYDLWKNTCDNTIIVTDVGQHQMFEAQYFKHENPRTLITSGGLGTMGFALPAAIGARFAKPESEIWMIAGDGGFQMTACELSTCVQEKININIAIINNGFLGMVRQWQEMFYGKRYESTPIISPDFVKLADAHGIPAQRVKTREEIPAAIAKARDIQGPCVVEFHVMPEEIVYPMVPAGADLDQMIRRPSPTQSSQ